MAELLTGMQIDTVLNKLKHVKPNGTNKWQADCPCPEHKTPARHLSIAVDNGKILLKCFGNHTVDDIVAALGIQVSDLFLDSQTVKQEPKIVKTYDYKDESGDVLFQAVRLEPKSFCLRHKNGGGEWHWNMKGVRWVIYNLPTVLEILPPDLIYIVEGEKDADNLMDYGLPATTSPGGAGNWKSEYAQYFKGKYVCLIPDKDEPGFKYAATVGKSLQGVASKIFQIILPGDVKDVSDYLDQLEDPTYIREKLNAITQPFGTDIADHPDHPDRSDHLDNLDHPDRPDHRDINDEIHKSDDTYTKTRGRILWPLVDQWLKEHQGEKFDLDTICRHLGVNDRDGRHSVVKKLSYEVSQEKLEKSDRLYIYINKTCKLIDWINASSLVTVNLEFPYNVKDGRRFGFADHVTISPGDVIVIAGVSNMGKTAFCLNLLWNNMDKYRCTLMGNEYHPAKFKRRVERMTWRKPIDASGLPKFELIERYDNWKAIIRPNNINIIDWINLSDNFYQIGTIIEGIKGKLVDGIAVISLQKGEGKSLGMGGGFSEHLASLYLAIDHEKLTVVKAKEWHGKNPNGRIYGFEIAEGVFFENIREMKKCPHCGGSGRYRGGECEPCQGKGSVSAEAGE